MFPTDVQFGMSMVPQWCRQVGPGLGVRGARTATTPPALCTRP